MGSLKIPRWYAQRAFLIDEKVRQRFTSSVDQATPSSCGEVPLRGCPLHVQCGAGVRHGELFTRRLRRQAMHQPCSGRVALTSGRTRASVHQTVCGFRTQFTDRLCAAPAPGGVGLQVAHTSLPSGSPTTFFLHSNNSPNRHPFWRKQHVEHNPIVTIRSVTQEVVVRFLHSVTHAIARDLACVTAEGPFYATHDQPATAARINRPAPRRWGPRPERQQQHQLGAFAATVERLGDPGPTEDA
jgi:hypothetical protein